MALEHAKKPAITGRPADLLKPEWEHLRTEALALAGCDGSDEDVLTFAMFPQVAPKFFKSRSEGPKNVGTDPAKKAAPAPAEHPPPANGKLPPSNSKVSYVITLNGKEHRVTVAPSM